MIQVGAGGLGLLGAIIGFAMSYKSAQNLADNVIRGFGVGAVLGTLFAFVAWASATISESAL